MVPDPTEEIRAIKRELAAKFDFDTRRIFEDIQRRQRESGRTYITLPKREPRPQPPVQQAAPAIPQRTTPEATQESTTTNG